MKHNQQKELPSRDSLKRENKSRQPKPLKIRLDPTKVGYRGIIVQQEMFDGNIALFPERLITFYAPHVMVSHQGNTDFSIYFGQFQLQWMTFDVNIVLVFSQAELMKFIDFLMKFTNEMTSETSQGEEEKNIPKEKKHEEVEETAIGMTLTSETFYYAPNAYIILPEPSGYRLYFGRNVGTREDGRQVSLFTCSVVIANIIELITVIKENVKMFESKKTATNNKDEI